MAEDVTRTLISNFFKDLNIPFNLWLQLPLFLQVCITHTCSDTFGKLIK